MDEEKQQKQFIKQVEDTANKGLEKQAKKTAMQKVMKTVIATIASILLKTVAITLIITIVLTIIKTWLDGSKSKESKDANAFAVHYMGGNGSSQGNESGIIVDTNNVTDGGYNLDYGFIDEEGESISLDSAITKIKNDLLEKNPDLDISVFSASELKVIGTLMYNGLDVREFNEEELQALVIFTKADIASKSFDFRTKEESQKEISLETIKNSDRVYGTIQVQKTKIESDADGKLKYVEQKLQYISYENFCNMDKNDDLELLNKFSVNEEGKLVVAKKTIQEINYEYVDREGNALSSEDIAKIPAEYRKENIPSTTTVDEVELERYSQISQYNLNYAVLLDLLIITDNVDFCLDLAERVFNSKVVINVKEEVSKTNQTITTDYTQTKLLYDYINYDVTRPTQDNILLAEYAQDPRTMGTDVTDYLYNKLGFPKEYISESSRTYFRWGDNIGTNDAPIYKYFLGRQAYTDTTTGKQLYKWVLYERKRVEHEILEKFNNFLIEKQYEQTLEEYYTAEEALEYTIIQKMDYEVTTCELEVFEVDTWYAKYKKQHNTPVPKPSETPVIEGDESCQYGEPTIIANTYDISEIDKDEHVIEFITEKENKYNNEGTQNNTRLAVCTVTNLEVQQKLKTVSKPTTESTTITYKFEDESADVTQIQYKNVQYLNGQASFTVGESEENPEKGFLYIYDKYRKDNVDLFLEDDAEKSLFELLQADETDSVAINSSNIIKFLLYIYDGIDRGITDLQISLIDLSSKRRVFGSSTENWIKAWESDSLWSYESGKTTAFPARRLTADGMNYIVYEDNSRGHNNIAYGMATFLSDDKGEVLHPVYGRGDYNSYWKDEFAAVGIYVENLYEGALVNKELVDSVFDNVLPDYIKIVTNCLENELAGYEFSQAQKDALTAIAYQYGTLSGFANAYIGALNEDGTLDAEKLAQNDYRFSSVEKVNDRTYANWLLFTQEIYIDRSGDVIEVWSGDSYANDKHDFPVYNQYDENWANYAYGGPRGLPSVAENKGNQKTIASSGCGCCATAMIISGYTGKLITPDILTDKLDEIYPRGSYYSPGKGSTLSVCSDKVLEEFGCYAIDCSRKEALEALKAGYAVLGGEDGHYLAFVPVSSEDAEMGYVFRILDSARGHNYLCRNFTEADNVVDGNARVFKIIYAPEN